MELCQKRSINIYNRLNVVEINNNNYSFLAALIFLHTQAKRNEKDLRYFELNRMLYEKRIATVYKNM